MSPTLLTKGLKTHEINSKANFNFSYSSSLLIKPIAYFQGLITPFIALILCLMASLNRFIYI